MIYLKCANHNYCCRHTGLQEKIWPTENHKKDKPNKFQQYKSSKQIQSNGTAAPSSNPSDCRLVLDPQIQTFYSCSNHGQGKYKSSPQPSNYLTM